MFSVVEGPFTVFLPSNEALTKIPADELAVLKENSTALRGQIFIPFI